LFGNALFPFSAVSEAASRRKAKDDESDPVRQHPLAPREKTHARPLPFFFRFASTPVKVIVYVWFSDEDTLRKPGFKTDVYETFKRMLAGGVVPGNIDAPLQHAS